MSRIYDKAKYICRTDQLENLSITPVNENEIDFESIITRDELIMHQNNICGIIKAPTTIMQKSHEFNNKFTRIDSQVASVTHRPTCSTFRTCAECGEDLCKKSDELYASLFFDIDVTNIETALNKKIEQNMRRIRKEFPNADTPNVQKRKGRVYLEYNCPILGYQEHIFPIIFESQVLGVLIVGQIRHMDKSNNILEHKKTFFKINDGIFSKYVKRAKAEFNLSESEKSDYTEKKIIEYICNGGRTPVSRYRRIFSHHSPGMLADDINNEFTSSEQKDYVEMIEKAIDCVINVEEELIRKMRVKREVHVNQVVSTEVTMFNRCLEIGNNPFGFIWANATNLFRGIVDSCGLLYIAAFGGDIDSPYLRKLKLKVFSPITIAERKSSDLSKVRELLDDCVFDLTTLSVLTDKNSGPLADDPVLFDALPKQYQRDKEKKSILLFPVSETMGASVALLIEYKSIDLKQSICTPINQALLNFLALLSTKILALSENVQQKRFEMTLRMYRHEITHCITTLRHPIDFYWNPEYEFLSEYQNRKAKFADIQHDAMNTLELLGYLSKNIHNMLSVVNEKKKEVLVFKDIFYKWNELRSVDANGKQLSFVLPDIHHSDEYRRSVLVDKYALEMIVYNLHDNAIKYSFRGTNIWADCVREFQEGHPILYIRDFGVQIEKGNDPYTAYYRAPNVLGLSVEGSGIGLHIVKMLTDTIRATRHHHCSTLSRFNIPMLYAYLKRSESERERATNLFIEAQEEFSYLSNRRIESMYGVDEEELPCIIEAVVSEEWIKYIDELTWDEIKDELEIPTYLVQFEVIL